MISTNRHSILPLTILTMFIITLGIYIVPSTNIYETNEKLNIMQNPQFGHSLLTNDEGNYHADLNWVKTIIKIEENGKGKVTILINCTPSELHIGMYIKPLVKNEPINVIEAETYAINNGQILAVNYTATFSPFYSYIINIKVPSLINLNETILYKFTYAADFFFSAQIEHYKVNPDLIYINLERPVWDGDLVYQELEIILPINVGQSNITSAFLNESKFIVESFMYDYYILSNGTTYDGEGNYWFTFYCRKNNLPVQGTFHIRFYLAKGYFILPKAINWLVILLVMVFSLIALTLFIIVTIIKNQSEKEVETFKEGLFDILQEEVKIAEEGK